MNKKEFIQELENKLKKLPQEEKEIALTYYQEYFEEAGEEKEEEAIKEIGSPSNIASQIMADFIVKETEKGEQKNVKHSISTVWIVILAILASPIALPIAIVVITLIFVTWLVIISFWLVGITITISGGICTFFSFLIFVKDIPLAILILGCGMIGLGCGIATTIGFANLFIKYSFWITTKISKSILRKEKSREE